MSPLNRDLSGDAILFRLADEQNIANDAALLQRNGRNARTLIKSGAMRVTIIVLAAGGGIPEHHTEGAITVQVLSGSMAFKVAGTTYDLTSGDLLSVGSGVHHEVTSKEGATFLLTIAVSSA